MVQKDRMTYAKTENSELTLALNACPELLLDLHRAESRCQVETENKKQQNKKNIIFSILTFLQVLLNSFCSSRFDSAQRERNLTLYKFGTSTIQKNFWLFLFFLLLSFTSLSQAFQLPDAGGALTGGTAGAYTAGDLSVEGFIYNPASDSQLSKAVLSAQYGVSALGTKESGLTASDGYYAPDLGMWRLLAASPVGKTGRLAFHFDSISYGAISTLQIAGLSFAAPISVGLPASDRLSWGVTGKYIYTKYATDGYTTEVSGLYGDAISAFSMDAGLMLSFDHGMKIGASILNLFSTDMGFRVKDPIASRWNLGASYPLPIKLPLDSVARVLADVKYSDRDYQLSGAVEWNVPRLGVTVDAGLNFRNLAVGANYEWKSRFLAGYSVEIFYVQNMAGSMNHEFSLSAMF